jgi:hypothetical protein
MINEKIHFKLPKSYYLLKSFKHKKELILFGQIFMAIVLLSWISINVDFYEDDIYRLFAYSFIHDLDFNIINQVSHQFAEIVTKTFSHPSHHSINQTPLLVLAYFFEKIIYLFSGNGSIRSFQMAGMFLNIFYLVAGTFFTKKSAELLGVKFRYRHMFFFIITTSLFYFSFLYIGTLEVFTFFLGAYALNGILNLRAKRSSHIHGFSLGVVLALLVTSKITFFPLVLAGTYYMVKEFSGGKKKIIQRYLLGMGVVFAANILRDYASFGGIYFMSKTVSLFVTDYSWLNFRETMRYGVLGEGGLFYSNIPYLLSLVGLFFLVKKEKLKEKETLFLWACLLVWLFMSLFQTVFMVGQILDDHYLGRMPLVSLPVMLIGIAYLDSVIDYKKIRFSKGFAVTGLVLWQIYTLLNFLVIENSGHYRYTQIKTVSNINDIYRYLIDFINQRDSLIASNYISFFLFTLGTTTFFYWIIKNSEKVLLHLKIVFHYIAIFLIIACVLHAFNSKRNGIKYLTDNKLMDKVTIGNDYSVYFFIYAVDTFRAQLYSTKNEELKKRIIEKHRNYLKHLGPMTLQTTPAFKKAIESRDINYGFFN